GFGKDDAVGDTHILYWHLPVLKFSKILAGKKWHVNFIRPDVAWTNTFATIADQADSRFIFAVVVDDGGAPSATVFPYQAAAVHDTLGGLGIAAGIFENLGIRCQAQVSRR